MSSPPPKPKRRRLRFSLRTLLLLVLLIASAATLWWNWGPWQLARRIDVRPHDLSTVQLSPDGATMLTMFENKNASSSRKSQYIVEATPATFNTIQLWRTRDGAQLWSVEGGYPSDRGDAANYLKFSPGGRWVHLFARYDIYLWEALWVSETGNEFHFPGDNSGEDHAVVFDQFSSDDKLFLYGSNGLFLYDAQTGKSSAVNLHLTERWNDLRISSDGRFLAGMSQKKVMLWNTQTHSTEWISDLPSDPIRTFARVAAFSPDASLLAVMTYSPAATHLYETKAGALIHSIRGNLIHFEESDVLPSNSRAPFSPDGTRIFTELEDRSIAVWNTQTGSQLYALSNESKKLMHAGFSADGQRIVTSPKWGFKNWDDELKTFDAATGAPLPALRGDGRWIAPGAFSADGNTAAIMNKGHAEIWRLTRPEQTLGPARLPEFWLTLILAIAFLWSLWRDRRIGARL